ncbi:MAG: hypothetical protein ACREQ5_06075 [Candidatus Dormibacteria bacterium]
MKRSTLALLLIAGVLAVPAAATFASNLNCTHVWRELWTCEHDPNNTAPPPPPAQAAPFQDVFLQNGTTLWCQTSAQAAAEMAGTNSSGMADTDCHGVRNG